MNKLSLPRTKCTTNTHEEYDDVNFHDETHFPSPLALSMSVIEGNARLPIIFIRWCGIPVAAVAVRRWCGTPLRRNVPTPRIGTVPEVFVNTLVPALPWILTRP